MIFVFTVVRVGHIDEQFVFVGDCMPSAVQFQEQIKTITIPELLDKYYRPMRHDMNSKIMSGADKLSASCLLDGGKLLMVSVFRLDSVPRTTIVDSHSQTIKAPVITA